MQIMKIEWHDARSIDGWCSEKDFDDHLSLIHTAGYLVKETDEALFISACAAIDEVSGNSYACTIVIPKKMIISLTLVEG